MKKMHGVVRCFLKGPWSVDGKDLGEVILYARDSLKPSDVFKVGFVGMSQDSSTVNSITLLVNDGTRIQIQVLLCPQSSPYSVGGLHRKLRD